MTPGFPQHGIITRRMFFDRGIAGLAFAIAGMILLFLFVHRDYWQLFAGAVTFGLLIAAVLRFRSDSAVPLSADHQYPRPEYPHQGITMHQIRFGGGLAGLVFTVGCMLIFLFGTPGLWVVFPAAIVLGVLIAAVLHFLHR